MKNGLRTALLVSLAMSITGCPPPPDESVESITVHVSQTEPGGDDESPLEAGVTLEASTEEAREALLVILKGVSDPAPDRPLTYEVVRAIDRPMYRDVDDAPGPEQWITRAHLEDADGNVLWSERVNTLYQLLEYLELVLDQTSPVNLSVSQLLSFVGQNYPELLEFGVTIPLGIEGAHEYVLQVPKPESDELYEVLRVELDELRAAAGPSLLEGEPELIHEGGDPRDSIDIVLLGDGYTADQREKFIGDTKVIMNRILATEPFASHKSLFNIHRVWTPSNEAGAGYDCTGIATIDAGCKDDLRDTQFETAFVISALADKFSLDLQDTSDRVAMPIQVARLYDAASAVPFDEIMMISNTRRTSGFAGLYVSVLTSYDPTRTSFPNTAVHELGHSFGVLGDEYDVEGDPCLDNEPRIPLPPNISNTAELDLLKWSYWIEDGTELPTPRNVGDGVVGAFQGTYNCDDLYRPELICKMRDSDQETFCPVCSEQLVKRMYSVVDPVGDQPYTASLGEDGAVVFTASLRDATVTAVTWELGDEVIGEGTTLEIAGSDLPQEWTKLTARVHASTDFVRREDPRFEARHTWWVRR